MGTITEEQPTAQNHMGELLKSLIVKLNQMSNQTMLNSQETIEIQAALDRIGDMPSDISKSVRESVADIVKDRNMVAIACLTDKGLIRQG